MGATWPFTVSAIDRVNNIVILRGPYAARTERLRRRPSVPVMTERDTVSHLLRRLTFGPTAAEVDGAVKAGAEASPRPRVAGLSMQRPLSLSCAAR